MFIGKFPKQPKKYLTIRFCYPKKCLNVFKIPPKISETLLLPKRTQPQRIPDRHFQPSPKIDTREGHFIYLVMCIYIKLIFRLIIITKGKYSIIHGHFHFVIVVHYPIPILLRHKQQQQQQQQFIVLLWNYSINKFIGDTVCGWWEHSHLEIAEANRAKWLSHAKFKLPVAYKLILIEIRPCSQRLVSRGLMIWLNEDNT